MSFGEIESGGNFGLYRFEGNGADSGPESHDLTGVNTPTYERGKFRQCCHLTKTSSEYFRRTGDDYGLDPKGTWTISSWIRADSHPFGGTTEQKYRVPWAFTWDNGSEAYYIRPTYYKDSGSQIHLYVFFRTNTWDSAGFESGTNDMTELESWAHLVVTMDSGNMRVYLNGRPSSDNPISVSGNDTSLGGHKFCVGCIYQSGYKFFWDGEIDELIITPAVWSIGEIRRYYAFGRGSIVDTSLLFR